MQLREHLRCYFAVLQRRIALKKKGPSGITVGKDLAHRSRKRSLF